MHVSWWLSANYGHAWHRTLPPVSRYQSPWEVNYMRRLVEDYVALTHTRLWNRRVSRAFLFRNNQIPGPRLTDAFGEAHLKAPLSSLPRLSSTFAPILGQFRRNLREKRGRIVRSTPRLIRFSKLSGRRDVLDKRHDNANSILPLGAGAWPTSRPFDNDFFINAGLARDLSASQSVHQKMFTFRRDARQERLLICLLEVEQSSDGTS